MVIYCAKNAIKTGLNVFVCTDSEEIMAVCSLYKVNSILTPECPTGTDRIASAVKDMNLEYIINLQGDEPNIDINDLKSFNRLIEINKPEIGTLASEINLKSNLSNENVVKVITDTKITDNNFFFALRAGMDDPPA